MRTVIIMSGISGSGKSTHIVNNFPKRNYPMWNGGDKEGAVIVSADHYFMDPLVGKKYTFDVSKLSEAHGTCFKHFVEACQRGAEMVVVDNTNTTSEEIAPYILGAQAFGYDVEILTVHCNPEIAAARNAHGVPVQGVMAQYKRLQERRLMPWWKNTDIHQ